MTDDVSEIDPLDRWFSDDLSTARTRFLAACDRLGLRVAAYPGAEAARPGATLWCEAARLGAPEAEAMLVVCSGAGGEAGYFGAAAATGVIAGDLFRDLPRNVACLLVHAVNPGGPVWPAALEPDAMAGAAATGLKADGGSWDDGLLSAAERRYAAFRDAERFDREALEGQRLAAVAPPAWDASVLDDLAERFLLGRKRVLFLDVRTGPGAFAEVERAAPGGTAGTPQRARDWLARTLDGEPAAIAGGGAPPAGGLPARLADTKAEKATVLLEVGTYSMATLLQAGPTPDGARRPALSSAYPREAAWRRTAWEAVADLIRRGFEGLSAAR